MSETHEPHRQYDDNFKRAAVEFYQHNGSTLEGAATELGISAADLRKWQKKFASQSLTGKPAGGIGFMKAENDALRKEVLNLNMQWDILKTTLGVLSRSVHGRN